MVCADFCRPVESQIWNRSSDKCNAIQKSCYLTSHTVVVRLWRFVLWKRAHHELLKCLNFNLVREMVRRVVVDSAIEELNRHLRSRYADVLDICHILSSRIPINFYNFWKKAFCKPQARHLLALSSRPSLEENRKNSERTSERKNWDFRDVRLQVLSSSDRVFYNSWKRFFLPKISVTQNVFSSLDQNISLYALRPISSTTFSFKKSVSQETKICKTSLLEKAVFSLQRNGGTWIDVDDIEMSLFCPPNLSFFREMNSAGQYRKRKVRNTFLHLRSDSNVLKVGHREHFFSLMSIF